ncbi:MAG: response regulator [Deltaproteobacteria bacterium]|nr:MAG: response regulator [Deltaproteobacteria bacterium]
MTRPPTILHVDDDPAIREIVRLLLEKIGGFAVTSVASGQEALAIVQRQPPDLVLLDVMMPGMSGPETLQALRDRQEHASLPVVFLTAKVLQSEMEQLARLDPAGIIQKPFRGEDLVSKVRQVLAGGRC